MKLELLNLRWRNNVEEYANELELQIDQLNLSLKRDQETVELVTKGIESHEKDVEQAEKTIKANVTRFKLLIELTKAVEDVCSMLDEKEEQIDALYTECMKIKTKDSGNTVGLKGIENEGEDGDSKPKHRGIGFRKSKFDMPAQEKTVTSEEVNNQL